MFRQLKKWAPMGLCIGMCIAMPLVLGVGLRSFGAGLGSAFGSLLAIVPFALVLLACPLLMGLMVRSMQHNAQVDGTGARSPCCSPTELSAETGYVEGKSGKNHGHAAQ